MPRVARLWSERSERSWPTKRGAPGRLMLGACCRRSLAPVWRRAVVVAGTGLADARESALVKDVTGDAGSAGRRGGEAASRRPRRPPVGGLVVFVGLIVLESVFFSLPDIVGRAGWGTVARVGLAATNCRCNSSIKTRPAPLARRGFAGLVFISFISAVVGNWFGLLFVDFWPFINCRPMTGLADAGRQLMRFLHVCCNSSFCFA